MLLTAVISATIALLCLLGTLALCFSAASIGPGDALRAAAARPLAVLYLGLVPSCLCGYLQILGQRVIEPARAAVIFSMDPVYALGFACALLGETPGVRGLGGCALIVCGVLVSAGRTCSPRCSRRIVLSILFSTLLGTLLLASLRPSTAPCCDGAEASPTLHGAGAYHAMKPLLTADALAEGRVMRAFTARVLSRDLQLENIVVVTVGARAARTFGARAAAQGHAVHRVARDVDAGWWGPLPRLARPSWVIAMVVDVDDANLGDGSEADALLGAASFLANTTVTYVVVHVGPGGRGPVGTAAGAVVRTLWAQHFNVQMLACTHALHGFAPNTLLRDDNLPRLVELRWARERNCGRTAETFSHDTNT